MSWAWLSTETSSRSARASSPCQHLPSRHPAKMTALPGKRAEVGSPVPACSLSGHPTLGHCASCWSLPA